MAFNDLREFITFLEQHGQLQRVTAPVSTDLEITEITDRVSKAGGPALLFEHVRGYDMPVLINTFGSEERMAWALGVKSLDELGDRIKRWLDIVQNRPPDGLLEKAKLAPELLELTRIGPHTVSHAPCQEVVITDHPSLDTLPILKCWPLDGGHYLT
ncbi:MAG: UbiD family decarboxylase domain-containing protein, partial [Ktedonobacterales bacterium]